MIRSTLLMLIIVFASIGSHAASDEEKMLKKKKEILAETQRLVVMYGTTNDPDQLKRLHGAVEKNWRDYTGAYGTTGTFSRGLAMLRARAASAYRSKKVVAPAWQAAIKLQPRTLKNYQKIGLYTEAGRSSASVGDFVSAEQFYTAAKLYADMKEKNKEQTRLYLNIQELMNTGRGMEWRRLNDRLLDMRKFSELFSMWSLPRLDALLAESDLRMAFQPNSDEEKRETLGKLKAKIELAQKGMDSSIPRLHLERVRTLYYSLEDTQGL